MSLWCLALSYEVLAPCDYTTYAQAFRFWQTVYKNVQVVNHSLLTWVFHSEWLTQPFITAPSRSTFNER